MMKKVFYLIVMIIATLCAPTNKAAAQDTDFWMEYALDRTALEAKIHEYTNDAETAKNYTYDLYLYCPEDNQFLNCDGDYGTQAVSHARGFGLVVEKRAQGWNDTYYYIRTAIMRETTSGALANYLGTDKTSTGYVYFDRDRGEIDTDSERDVRWQVVPINNKTFQLILTEEATAWYENDKTLYLHHDKNTGDFKLSENEADASKFAFLNADSYHQAIKDLAIQKEVNVTGLVLNSRFGRNVKNSMWGFYDMNSNPVTDEAGHSIAMDMAFGSIEDAGDGYASDYGKYGSAEIDVNTSGFYRQQVTGLRNGLYKVKARCVYYPTEGENSSAFLYAKNNGTLITPLDDAAKTEFDSYVNKHKNLVSDLSYYQDAFRWNVPAAEYMENNLQTCEFEVYATVTDGTLGFGISKREDAGYVFIDEVELYFYGDYEFGMDAYNTDMDKVDERAYTTPRRYNLRRNFNLNMWNSLILPVDLTSGIIMGAFGEDVKVTRLAGINPDNTNQILFEPVHLERGEGTKAGECYLIYITKEPNVATGETYNYTIIGETNPEDLIEVKAEGPIYHLDGVTRDEKFAPKKIDGKHGEGEYELEYTGFFYHNPTGAPAGSYIMSKGKVYHLTEPHYLSGSYWYLTTPGSQSEQSKTFVIAEEGQSTDINGIVTEKTGNAQDGVYNLNGQKVADGTSLEGLTKGVYVVNGKKYVVK